MVQSLAPSYGMLLYCVNYYSMYNCAPYMYMYNILDYMYSSQYNKNLSLIHQHILESHSVLISQPRIFVVLYMYMYLATMCTMSGYVLVYMYIHCTCIPLERMSSICTQQPYKTIQMNFWSSSDVVIVLLRL